MFGKYVRQLRLKQQMTLRQFCGAVGIDASYWSKIERGVSSPPGSDGLLGQIARTLRIKKNSEEWALLCDYAALAKHQIPEDIISNKELAKKLPLFFRTLRNERPTEKELQELADLLKHG